MILAEMVTKEEQEFRKEIWWVCARVCPGKPKDLSTADYRMIYLCKYVSVALMEYNGTWQWMNDKNGEKEEFYENLDL